MENENKQQGIQAKQNEFKQRRMEAKCEMQKRLGEIQEDLYELKTINRADERKAAVEAQALRAEAREAYAKKLAAIAAEEDAWRSEFDEYRSRPERHVMAHYDAEGKADGVRICVKDLGMDFMIKLHNELDGREVEYAEAEKFSLPDEKMVRVIGFYRKEVDQLLKDLGGDPLDNWYWTSTPASEVFGAYGVNNQLVYRGTYGGLGNYGRISSVAVRVALAL